MTAPADITTDGSWDRLNAALSVQRHQIDDLRDNIAADKAAMEETEGEAQKKYAERKELMADPDTYPYPSYDRDADERDEFADDERLRDEVELDDERSRLEAEADDQAAGDFDIDLDDLQP